MGWFRSWHVGVTLATLCAAPACGADAPANSAEESSTGSEAPTTSSSTTSTSGDVDDSSSTGGASSSSSSSSDGSSTGDELPTPADVRVYYTLNAGTPEQNGTWILDVIAGELGEPVRVMEDVPYPWWASPSRRWRVDQGAPGASGALVRLLDLDAVPPIPASVVDLDDGSDFQLFSEFAFTRDESAIAVVVRGQDDARLYTFTLDGDAPGVPWRADSELPGSAYALDVEYLPDDTQLVVTTTDPVTDTRALVLAPVDADAPPGIVPIVTTLVGEAIEYAGATTDGALLAYRVWSDDAHRGYVVDMESLPAVPVELPLPAPEMLLGQIQIAPDDSAVAYAVRESLTPDSEWHTLWGTLENGVVQPPVELAPGYSTVYGVGAWSSDMRWIGLFDDGEPGTALVVRLDEGVPSAPFELGPFVRSLTDVRVSFTSDGWFYYLTEIEGDEAIMRVDVTGEIPGAPQVVGEIVDDVLLYWISADASTLVATYSMTNGADYEGFAIDLGGSEPGDAVKISAPLAAGELVYDMWISGDGRSALYQRWSADKTKRYGHYVDVTTPGVASALAEGVPIDNTGIRDLQ